MNLIFIDFGEFENHLIHKNLTFFGFRFVLLEVIVFFAKNFVILLLFVVMEYWLLLCLVKHNHIVSMSIRSGPVDKQTTLHYFPLLVYYLLSNLVSKFIWLIL